MQVVYNILIQSALIITFFYSAHEDLVTDIMKIVLLKVVSFLKFIGLL